MTVRRSMSAYSWKIMAIRRRAARNPRLDSLVISRPSSRTCPEVGSTRRLMQRIRVLLPAPEGPMSATTCPGSTRSDTPVNATSPVAYRLLRSTISSMDLNRESDRRCRPS